jgi:hypothetical protein
MKAKLLHFAALVALSFLFTNCEKDEFDHGEPEFSYPCACCERAAIIVGDYAGRLTTSKYDFGASGGPVLLEYTDDSVFFTITRVYKSGDFMSDSLICEFEIPDFFTETIYMHDNSGYFAPKQYSTQLFTESDNLLLSRRTNVSGYGDFTTFSLNAEKE